MRVALLFVVAALPVHAEDILVTNSGDAVNGDVSSPAALHRTPGPDGISLREAILAANNALGPHAIRFDSSLARQSISLGSSLPEISTDGISVVGPVDSAGEPFITIVNPPGSQGSILSVRASNFTLCRLSFIDLREGGAVGIRTGSPPQPPNDITDLRIQGNYFKGLAGADYINAVTIGVENRATNASITNVTIASNKFVDIRNADSVGMGAGASVNGRLADVFVVDNLFLSSSFGVEIASSAVGGRVEHVVIARNTFLDNFQPITLTGSIGLQHFPPAHDNITRDITVANNYIARSENPAFSMVGGLDASNSVLEDVQIINNVIAENQTCGLCLNGGQSFVSSATRNQIRAVRIVNNTITGVGFAAGVSAVRNLGDRATENLITDVRVVNTLFANQRGMGLDFGQEKQLIEASFCVTADPERIGVNGNVSGDPLFVDRAVGDYHLRAGSVAINAGTFVGAPSRDRDGLARRGAFDIGAYEFDGLRLKLRAVSDSDACSP